LENCLSHCPIMFIYRQMMLAFIMQVVWKWNLLIKRLDCLFMPIWRNIQARGILITYWTTPSSKERAKQNRLLYFAANLTELTITNDKLGVEVLYDDIADTEEFKLLKEMAIDGRSYLEMADSRNISIDTCRKRVQRAKETLRKKIRF